MNTEPNLPPGTHRHHIDESAGAYSSEEQREQIELERADNWHNDRGERECRTEGE